MVSYEHAGKRGRGAGLTPEQRRQRDSRAGRHAQAELRARTRMIYQVAGVRA